MSEVKKNNEETTSKSSSCAGDYYIEKVIIMTVASATAINKGEINMNNKRCVNENCRYWEDDIDNGCRINDDISVCDKRMQEDAPSSSCVGDYSTATIQEKYTAKEVQHILRNQWGKSKETVKEAQLRACEILDEWEQWSIDILKWAENNGLDVKCYNNKAD